MKREFYRFRSIWNLLDGFSELDNQSIYFATQKELNDPMEGYRDLYWQGDLVLWRNLFKNYIYCLESVVSLYNIGGESQSITEELIPIYGGFDELPTDMYKDLHNKIYERFFANNLINKLIDYLASSSRVVRRQELSFYLKAINLPLIKMIYDIYIENGLTPASNNFPIDIDDILNKNLQCTNILNASVDDKMSDAMFITSEHVSNQINLNYFIDDDGTKENKRFIFLDFHIFYMKRLEELTFPSWYLACFMDGFQNSTAWGVYGDNHGGCCLIFEAERQEGNDDSYSISLNGINGIGRDGYHRSFMKESIMKVNYIEGFNPVSFFDNLGVLPTPKLNSNWMTYKNDISSAFKTRHNSIQEWRNSYWENFTRDVLIKTKDWSYENEYRIIIYSTIVDLSPKENRVLNYNFKSLKGIIFGMKTTDHNKKRIFEIVRKKCMENNVNDFKFYQSYYCHVDNCIKKVEMVFLNSKLKDICRS